MAMGVSMGVALRFCRKQNSLSLDGSSGKNSSRLNKKYLNLVVCRLFCLGYVVIIRVSVFVFPELTIESRTLEFSATHNILHALTEILR